MLSVIGYLNKIVEDRDEMSRAAFKDFSEENPKKLEDLKDHIVEYYRKMEEAENEIDKALKFK